MAIAATVKAHLNQAGVDYQVVPHPRTYSSKDTAQAAHVWEDQIAKAVILKDQRGFVMAVIPGSKWVKLHALQQELDRDLEITPEEEIDTLFRDCEPGAIPPLGTAYGIETVLDEALTSLGKVYFEAGDHEHLIHIDGRAFLQLLGGVRRGHFSHPD